MLVSAQYYNMGEAQCTKVQCSLLNKNKSTMYLILVHCCNIRGIKHFGGSNGKSTCYQAIA